MKTFTPKKEEIERKWYIADADGQILGRFASQIAHILRGKHKPIFTPHLDVGDHVIVINADKIQITGRKANQKRYYHHTGYPGGLHSIEYSRMVHQHPDRVLKLAVRGMLPHNKLGRQMLKKLRIYANAEHPHHAQQPETLEIK